MCSVVDCEVRNQSGGRLIRITGQSSTLPWLGNSRCAGPLGALAEFLATRVQVGLCRGWSCCAVLCCHKRHTRLPPARHSKAQRCTVTPQHWVQTFQGVAASTPQHSAAPSSAPSSRCSKAPLLANTVAGAMACSLCCHNSPLTAFSPPIHRRAPCPSTKQGVGRSYWHLPASSRPHTGPKFLPAADGLGKHQTSVSRTRHQYGASIFTPPSGRDLLLHLPTSEWRGLHRAYGARFAPPLRPFVSPHRRAL